MILLFFLIHILTLQQIFVDSMQTTNVMEDRLNKLERKGLEQEAIIQKLMSDMEEYKQETKAQTEMIHDLSIELQRHAEQLILKEKKISHLENKLDKLLDRQYSTKENFKNTSGDNLEKSSRNKVTTLKDEKINEDNYQALNMEKRSIRQRRLQLPVQTQPPKMNIAFRVSKNCNGSASILHDFDRVYLNLGGGFNPSSTNFTAPTSGLYLFTLSVLVSQNDRSIYMQAGVKMNNRYIDQIILIESNNNLHQKSVTVIAQVKTGDIVSADSIFYTLNNNVTITFSGVLISQM